MEKLPSGILCLIFSAAMVATTLGDSPKPAIAVQNTNQVSVYKFRSISLSNAFETLIESHEAAYARVSALFRSATNDTAPWIQSLIPEEILPLAGEEQWMRLESLWKLLDGVHKPAIRGPAAVSLILINTGSVRGVSFFLDEQSHWYDWFDKCEKSTRVTRRVYPTNLDVFVVAIVREDSSVTSRANNDRDELLRQSLSLFDNESISNAALVELVLGQGVDGSRLVSTQRLSSDGVRDALRSITASDVAPIVVAQGFQLDARLGSRDVQVIESTDVVDDFAKLVVPNILSGRSIELPASGKTNGELKIASALVEQTMVKRAYRLFVYKNVKPVAVPDKDAVFVFESTLQETNALKQHEERQSTWSQRVARVGQLIEEDAASYTNATPEARLVLRQAMLADTEIRDNFKAQAAALESPKAIRVASLPAYLRTRESVSFSLSFAIKDVKSVKYDTEKGVVVAKEEDKPPTFLTINYHPWPKEKRIKDDSVNKDAPSDIWVRPYIMFGPRINIESFEPMLGLGSGWQLKAWGQRFGVGLWAGCVLNQEDELKGDAMVGDTPSGIFTQTKYSPELVFGISVSWP